MKISKLANMSMFTALALIFSYIESMIPAFIAIPGIKLGLANIVVIVLLCKTSWKEALIVSIVRVVISSLLFGTIMTFLYSFVGAIFSLLVMIILKKISNLTNVTISVLGGVFHNFGQIIVACIITSTAQIIYYLPILLISGTISGIIIGFLATLIVKRLKSFEF